MTSILTGFEPTIIDDGYIAYRSCVVDFTGNGANPYILAGMAAVAQLIRSELNAAGNFYGNVIYYGIADQAARNTAYVQPFIITTKRTTPCFVSFNAKAFCNIYFYVVNRTIIAQLGE